MGISLAELLWGIVFGMILIVVVSVIIMIATGEMSQNGKT